ncbi:ChbG/HpnK family deacetylase [Flavitalea sp. BT771]|uniref:carbohydrate deacetylase n=1 Tax=Flavitalea sp. BT771 TaxID=3063329 RepID=UPI0026E1D47E|nr:ChbG/HpnK family deacetylase [Flavitalea sp. BT771]MDO6432913.1 ChbG/HpnK family deacetylase [Flavitalea sp. BT771]MDV6221811.1 ChbG/HpnK family deacetylase [Flavitalea sp. BT771]
MRTANKIIINADDFGYSDVINSAVLRSFQRFLVTSASLLVNMPGFDHAAGLVQEHACLSGVVGVRLNFSEGYSLTSAIRDCERFCDGGGRFVLQDGRRLLLLSSHEERAVYEEMKAQLEKALMAGIRPSHLDIHHSLHAQWPVACLMAKLGREYGVPRMRFFRNLGPHMRGVRGIHRRWFLRVIWRYMGVTGPDLSGDADDLLGLPAKRRPMGKNIEIGVSPRVDEYGDLTDRSGKGLQWKLRPVIDHRHTMSYTGLPVRAGGWRLVDMLNKWTIPVEGVQAKFR